MGPSVTLNGVVSGLTFSALLQQLPVTPIAQTAGTTLIGPALTGGLLRRSGPSAPFTDVTDTAANIANALLATNVGQSWIQFLTNETTQPWTLSAGAGVTFVGIPNLVIPPNCMAVLIAQFPNTGSIVFTLAAILDRGTDNFTATTEPGVGNDNTQGYGPGSLWFDVTANRVWECISAATGTAVWAGPSVVPGVGVLPSNMLTAFGGSPALGPTLTPFAQFTEEGSLQKLFANPIASNGADATDDILTGIVVPALAFSASGNGLQFNCFGKFGATANNKRIKLWLNPTMAGQAVTAGVISGGTVTGVGSGALLFDSNVQTGNAVGWAFLVSLFKYGALGSNTQISQAQSMFGTTHGGCTVPLVTTQTESVAMNFVLTGSSPTSSAAGDVVANGFQVTAMN